MPGNEALDLVSFVARPRILHVVEFLLYSSAYGVKRIFLWGGLWVAEVSLMETVFHYQQLLDIVTVTVKPVLVLSGWGPQNLCDDVVDFLHYPPIKGSVKQSFCYPKTYQLNSQYTDHMYSTGLM